jgi:hypothetical protein
VLGILSDDLAPGWRLPSTRELARRFHLIPTLTTRIEAIRSDHMRLPNNVAQFPLSLLSESSIAERAAKKTSSGSQNPNRFVVNPCIPCDRD